jgi:muramidase (phage lysozyme)
MSLDTQDSDISFLSGFKPKEVPLTDEDVKHPNVQAYLNYLNAYEGKPAPNQIVGYKEFKDLSDHPKQKVVFNDKGDVSDAAGAYQLLGSTWDTQKKKYGLKDFSLPNQQKAAVGILKDIGALPYIQSGEFDKANELARGQWASLPGSIIGLKTGQIPKLNPEAENILTQAKAEYDPDISFLSGFKPKEKIEKSVQTLKDISAFSNKEPTELDANAPAIKQLGKKLAEDIQKPLNEMSFEDFKKKSLLAPAATYTAASLGMPGFTEKEKQEAQANLEQKGSNLVKALKNVANMPVQDFTQGVINAGKQLVEHPGTAIGEQVKSTIYDPEQLLAPQAISAAGKPLMAGGRKVAGAITEAAMKEPFVANRVANIQSGTSQVKNQMAEAFANAKQRFNEPEANVTVTGAPNVGAAQATKQSAVNAILPDLSSETQAIVKSTPIKKLNLPALETKALEEKHGIRLSQGQRTENTGRYAEEWNQRASDQRIQDLFNNQPEQFKNAIENIKERYTPLMGDAKGEDFGQILMDEYAFNDAAHVKSIQKSYGDLKQRHNEMLAERGFPAESGMPLDTQAFVNHAKNNLHDEFLMADAEKSGLMGDLSRIEKNGMTLPEFIAFDKRLSRMQRGADKEAAAAAGQIRNAFEQIPLKEGMEELIPQYKAAKDLAKQRFDKINTIPGYKFAIEAKPFVNEAGEQMGSTGANKFYNNFINNLSTGDLRRVKAEFANNPKALEAIKGAELEKIVKKAGFTGDMGKFTPKQLNDYLVNNNLGLVEKIGPEALNDLMEINVLGAKVAKPDAGVFNHSNSLSGLFGSLAKQGMQTKAEAALAAKTGGASILPVQALKSAAEFINKGKFAAETVHPHSGLVNKE